jgi:uncharacterized protein (TIGR00730 family)
MRHFALAAGGVEWQLFDAGRGQFDTGAGMPKKYPNAVKLAYQDSRFMESATARPIRIVSEYLDPLSRLRKEGVGDTIVMFGSARILPRAAAEERLARARRNAKKRHTNAAREEVRAARNEVEMSHYYEDARALARKVTTWAMSLGSNPRRFVICSGGGPGIMEAANRGAAEAGGKSVGLSIELPHEQEPNSYISKELSFNFHYFFMRKLWFAQLAKALIVFPGGFGTMDELWEMLTLMQTGKLPDHNLVLIYGRRYWDRVLNWREMLRSGTINAREYGLLRFSDSVEDAFDQIRGVLEQYHMKLDSDLTE